MSICLSTHAQHLNWSLGNIPVDRLDEQIFIYHMLDTTGAKIGGMTTQIVLDNENIAFIDTSQFDNGSIYEDATFTYSKNPIRATNAKINLRNAQTSLKFHLNMEPDSIVGTVLVNGEGRQVKMAGNYDIIRSELYAFFHTLDFNDSLDLKIKVFEPTSLKVTEASLEFAGEVDFNGPLGTSIAYKILLDGKGGIPTNIIYIDKDRYRVLKYEVISPMRLDILLTEVR